MSQLKVALENDLKLLAMARDEIGLQAHLMGAEVKERWQQLESKWSELQGHINRAEGAAADAAKDAEAAASLLATSLREGYDKVRKSLKS